MGLLNLNELKEQTKKKELDASSGTLPAEQAQNAAKIENAYLNKDKQENTVKTPNNASQEETLKYPALEAEKNARANARKAYRNYQTNIRKAGDYRTQILKGIADGAPAINLLLKACKCIALMTADKTFKDQIEQGLIHHYGQTMLEPEPIEWELAATKERIAKLEQALGHEPPQSKDYERIANALKIYRDNEKEMAELLTKIK